MEEALVKSEFMPRRTMVILRGSCSSAGHFCPGGRSIVCLMRGALLCSTTVLLMRRGAAAADGDESR